MSQAPGLPIFLPKTEHPLRGAHSPTPGQTLASFCIVELVLYSTVEIEPFSTVEIEPNIWIVNASMVVADGMYVM